MYLRSKDWYKLTQRDLAYGLSQKSGDKSVTNSYHILKPIVEENSNPNSTSSMSLEAQNPKVPEYSMAFNVRLAFMKTNHHGAQLYKDPMNCWVIKVEDHPKVFEAAPWVNYQGELYMGQGGDRYVVKIDPDNVNKWRIATYVAKKEEPLFGDSEALKLLNAIKVCHLPMR